MPFKNKEEAKAYHKKWRDSRRDILNAQKKEWVKNNLEKARLSANLGQMRYYRKNQDKVNKRNALRRRSRYQTDPLYRMKRNVCSRVSIAIKDGTFSIRNKCDNSLSLIGCTLKELRQHIESLWTVGMSWDNYGLHGWHIDHIKPCASFNLLDPKEQIACFHYKNLQPLWAKDNIAKSNRISAPKEEERKTNRRP